MFENQLHQYFSCDQPNQKWVGDVTYLATNEGWFYLVVVLDLYSRRVIGWSMDKRMAAELVCNALQMAIRQRQRPPNVIVIPIVAAKIDSVYMLPMTSKVR